METSDELGTNDVHSTQPKHEKVTFLNMPNMIIDLTENKAFIRNVIAFSGSDKEMEMDCQLNWIGDFPDPIVFKIEKDAEEHGSLAMEPKNELINDGLLGNLNFRIDVRIHVISFNQISSHN